MVDVSPQKGFSFLVWFALPTSGSQEITGIWHAVVLLPRNINRGGVVFTRIESWSDDVSWLFLRVVLHRSAARDRRLSIRDG